MADAPEYAIPRVVADLNLRIARLLKDIPEQDFLTVLSHPSTVARVRPQQQQQQQQQQQRAAAAE
jgi:hypothetical protein